MHCAIGFLLLFLGLFWVFFLQSFPQNVYPRLTQHGEFSKLRGRSDYSWLGRRRHCTFTANFTAYLCPSALMADGICPECCQHHSVISFPPKTYLANTAICIRVDGKIEEQCIMGPEKNWCSPQKGSPKLHWSRRASVDFLPGRWRMMLVHLLPELDSVAQVWDFSTLESIQGDKQI